MSIKKQLRFFNSKNGVLNLEVNGLCYYSKYNPDRDIEKFLLPQLNSSKKRYIIFGLGLGYHAQKLLQLDSKEIVVFENDISLLQEVNKRVDLKQLFNSPRLKLITEWQNLKLSDVEDQIILLPTWYKTLDDMQMKEVFQSIIINRNTSKSKELLNYNFTMNGKHDFNNMMGLKNILQGKKAILVAAGPSLDDEINFLKSAKGKCFILAVGAAYKTLYSEGLEPDALIITDPNPSVYAQIENINLTIPLFFASTVFPNVVLHHAPLKVMLFQRGVKLAEDYANNKDISLLETGGSVANMAFSLLLFMGCKSLIFVGQDLAYIDGKNHSNRSSSNVVIKNNIHSLFKTISNEGKKVETSGSWNYYRSFFEKEILKYKDIEFINTSLKGASIKGACYKKSKEILLEIEEVTNYPDLLIKQFKL